MLDFNHRQKPGEKITGAIDDALEAANQLQPPRDYLGGSRLGVSCERALQYEYMKKPKDEGREFKGKTLRIFQIGHALEDMAAAWLREAGFSLHTAKSNGQQFGFSVADGKIKGHVDGIIESGPILEVFPALWECKTMNAKNWRACVKHGVAKSKPVYAAQMATYQAYMEADVEGISKAPALFTAINKDTAELHHELVSFNGELAQAATDKAVRIIQATEAGDIQPRIAQDSDFFECKWCDWRDRCWGTP